MSTDALCNKNALIPGLMIIVDVYTFKSSKILLIYIKFKSQSVESDTMFSEKIIFMFLFRTIYFILYIIYYIVDLKERYAKETHKTLRLTLKEPIKFYI